jgi:hypothetical protein
MWAFYKLNDYWTYVNPFYLNEWDAFNVQQDVDYNFAKHWKRLIIYNQNHGTTTMNHQVVIKHFVVLNKYNTWCLNTTIIIDVQQGA